MTAYELVDRVMESNSPIDWGWLRHLKRTYTHKELIEWCRNNVEHEAPSDASPWLITRAANLLCVKLF